MKILLIDHHNLFRDGLCHLLQNKSMGIDQILEADNFSAGLRQAEQHPDIILLEFYAPECDGLNAIKTLRRRFPLIPVVVVSSEEDSKIVSQALRYGASGYVCKSSSGSVLLNAMELVLAGSIYVPMQFLQQKRKMDDIQISDNVELTHRQRQVLSLLHKGSSNKQIATELNLMEGTVKAHVAAIFQALQVNRRTEAVQVAKQRKLF